MLVHVLMLFTVALYVWYKLNREWHGAGAVVVGVPEMLGALFDLLPPSIGLVAGPVHQSPPATGACVCTHAHHICTESTTGRRRHRHTYRYSSRSKP
jgi:hypothetical protein